MEIDRSFRCALLCVSRIAENLLQSGFADSDHTNDHRYAIFGHYVLLNCEVAKTRTRNGICRCVKKAGLFGNVPLHFKSAD